MLGLRAAERPLKTFLSNRVSPPHLEQREQAGTLCPAAHPARPGLRPPPGLGRSPQPRVDSQRPEHAVTLCGLQVAYKSSPSKCRPHAASCACLVPVNHWNHLLTIVPFYRRGNKGESMASVLQAGLGRVSALEPHPEALDHHATRVPRHTAHPPRTPIGRYIGGRGQCWLCIIGHWSSVNWGFPQQTQGPGFRCKWCLWPVHPQQGWESGEVRPGNDHQRGVPKSHTTGQPLGPQSLA